MRYFCLFFFALLVYSCEESVVEPDLSGLGSEYFPLSENETRIYSVKEITIDAPSERYDTLEYELKTVVVLPVDFEADTSRYLLERYIRTAENTKWEIKDIWEINKDKRSAVIYEENVPYVKLSFPVEKGSKWDGNVMNTEVEQEYKISELLDSYQINELSFDSVAVVSHIDIETSIDKKFSEERYVKGVGLIEKNKIDVYAEYDQNADLMERIQTGYIYTQKIISY